MHPYCQKTYGKRNQPKPAVREESTVRVYYAIKALEELICITEGKQHQIAIGFAQVCVNDFFALDGA
jgi:hypothetical protein